MGWRSFSSIVRVDCTFISLIKCRCSPAFLVEITGMTQRLLWCYESFYDLDFFFLQWRWQQEHFIKPLILTLFHAEDSK